ncbi:hypothetical protein WISP_147948 [Willisornis vidua]|uniref:Uncharacterized protein n=1 Tax=Willisornis vidua TaxID=1566151 RepID=A0ABQ9CMZ5_9PASS|nr:hypothetical protein WISP_147948 [Willisornis vidua]
MPMLSSSPGGRKKPLVTCQDDRLRETQCSELENHDCENDQLQFDPENMWDLLLQLDLYKSMKPDGIHPRILKKLVDAITKAFLMIWE